MEYRLEYCLLFRILMLCWLWEITATDMFSSTPQLSSMFQFEKDLVTKMDHYLVNARNKLTIFQNLSENFDNIWQENINATLSGELILNITSQQHWIQMLKISGWNPFQGILDDIGDSWMSKVPDKDSLLGALHSIIRLIHIYQLDPRDMTSKGVIQGAKASMAHLGPEDCRNLALVAIERGYFDIAYKLTDLAIELKLDTEWVTVMSRIWRLAEYGEIEMAKPEPYEYLDEFGERLDEPEEDPGTTLDNISMDDLQYQFSWSLNTSADQPPTWTVTIQTYNPEEGFVIPDKASPNVVEYEALCRGDRVKVDDNLTCYFQYGGLPYYSRWKAEVLQREPLVRMFHDFVTEGEIRALKKAGEPLMTRARVFQGDSRGVSQMRVGKVAWIDDSDIDTYVDHLNQRITEVSGLDSVDFAEHLQLSVYGMGGMYEPHCDYNRLVFKHGVTDGKRMGDRLATFMIYLSDVEAGGATVFPLWRLAAFPVKGAAILWHNQFKDGVSNPSTLHAGCPVLLGHKWVANKWIHEYGQEFRYPCDLKQDSPVEYQIMG